MKRKLPWYKRDVDAWRGGTRSMSMELRGFYSECLDAIWDLQGPLPACEAKLAVMLCCNPRTVRKLLPELVALGKLIRTADGYINRRMASELASQPIASEFAPNSTPIRSEFEPKVTNSSTKSMVEISTKKEEEEKEEEKNNNVVPHSVAARSGRAVPKVDLDRMIEACGSALDNPVNCQGLLTAATPIMWLESGCDMDRDIIPTMEAIGKKRPGSRIRSWEYFTQPIADARDRRLRGMPEPSAAPNGTVSFADEQKRRGLEFLKKIEALQ